MVSPAGLHFPYADLTLNARRGPILLARMRLALVSTLVLLLAASAGRAAARPAETLSIEGAHGTITLRGSGVVIGRIERGDVQIVDLSALDQWSPRINGVPRGKLVWTRGKDINIYVPGGRYRIVVKGEGIAISARGHGVVTLDGRPDAAGAAGSYNVGDDDAVPLPHSTAQISYGTLVPAKAAGQ